MLRLTLMTSEQIVRRPSWLDAPWKRGAARVGRRHPHHARSGARSARADLRVYIQRAREAGIAWEQVGRCARHRRNRRCAAGAWPRLPSDPVADAGDVLGGQLGTFLWICPDGADLASTMARSATTRLRTSSGTPKAASALFAQAAEWFSQAPALTPSLRPHPSPPCLPTSVAQPRCLPILLPAANRRTCHSGKGDHTRAPCGDHGQFGRQVTLD